MKKLKGQLLRWILIVRKLQNQPYISFRELQRELERELAFRGYDPVCSDASALWAERTGLPFTVPADWRIWPMPFLTSWD